MNFNWNLDKGHKEDKDKPSNYSNRDKYEDKDDDGDRANKEWY